ncbi:hypothetical protein [Spiroplasma phoeniceum]|uniref:Uncharacterized protein n=1 Tax=Spiroplasma phoeniceum P40 TaxID=1276259 RepID=A0A345DPR9_9MOLU|nr:hypothetical protein [Spiroplasma phoeniceum]AXF95084.1 hypothetical protein SDAV_0068 [Spiroplasma phoeniceum P40]AXF96207.1 hypothetical protein SDAV_001240 [Spiroplasma phoeniceum P40]
MKKVNKEISDEIMKYVINSDFDNLRNITNELYIKGNFSNETKEMLFDIINKFDKTTIKENKRIVIPVKKITDENSIFSVSPKKKKKIINIVFK